MTEIITHPATEADLWTPQGSPVSRSAAELILPDLVVVSGEPAQDKKEALMGTINNLGTLNGVINESNSELVVYPKSKIWTGAISLEQRLANDPDFAQRVEVALKPETIEPYYVQADLDARTRCIDGRLLEGWMESLELQKRDLGPQVPGGAATMALAMRLVDGMDLTSHTTLASDIDDSISLLVSHGLSFGGHIDDHAGEGKTGCGAIDQLKPILEKFQQPETSFQMRGLVSALMGEAYDTDLYNSIIGELQNVWALQSIYLAQNDQGQFEYNIHAIDALRKNATDENPVAKLVGAHNEVGLVINRVPHTTFNRDKYNSDHNSEIQLFNYDIWYSEQLAATLYPVSGAMKLADRQVNIQKQVKFLTVRSMLAVATAMQLTDGSVDLLLRL